MATRANLIKELGFAESGYWTNTFSHSCFRWNAEFTQEAGIHTSLSQIEQEAQKLLLPFEILREKGRFVLFKNRYCDLMELCKCKSRVEKSRIFTHNQLTQCV